MLIGGYVPEKLSAVNPLNSDLNPICHLLALLGARHILHVSGIRFKTLVTGTGK
jgi:hypothetical protein